MVRNPSLSSFNLAWVFTGVTLTGLALSMALTTDSQWSHWHLSRLGEGGSFAASIFNFSLIVAGLILSWLGVKVANEIKDDRPHAGAFILRSILLFIALCWIGVASFPFDKSPIIHNIFGYAQFFAVAYAMLGLKWLCPRFSIRTYYIGYGAALLTGLLMALFHMTHFTTLLVVELIGQLFIYIWILSMTADQNGYLQK
jgi:hypothetical membrane protein